MSNEWSEHHHEPQARLIQERDERIASMQRDFNKVMDRIEYLESCLSAYKGMVNDYQYVANAAVDQMKCLQEELNTIKRANIVKTEY